MTGSSTRGTSHMTRSRMAHEKSPGQVASDGPTPVLDTMEQRLTELAGLAPNWDSYGGAAPTAVAISCARQLMHQVVQSHDALGADHLLPFALGPTADGGILVEWRAPTRSIATLIGPD